jgi:hypothetical protein
MIEIQELVIENLKHFYSEEHDCYYFVFDNKLYGIKIINNDLFDFSLASIWREENDWCLLPNDDQENELTVADMSDFEYLDDEAIENLIVKIKILYNIKNELM